MLKPKVRLNTKAKPNVWRIDGGLWACKYLNSSHCVPIGLGNTPEQAFNNMWKALNLWYAVEQFEGQPGGAAIIPAKPSF